MTHQFQQVAVSPESVIIRKSVSGPARITHHALIKDFIMMKAIVTLCVAAWLCFVTLVMDRIQEDETKPRGGLGQKGNLAVTGDIIRLRSQPRTLTDRDIGDMIIKHNFYCGHYDRTNKWYNESGDFENDFVKSSDGKTVTDRRTELMWQQSGSDDSMNHKNAQEYIRKLNSRQFAGYSDWRLPTVEELASLLESRKVNGRYIDPVFDKKQQWCWSSDKRVSGVAWLVSFNLGRVSWLYVYYYVRAVRPRQ
ncbi:DUF1566 domain-containing protein [Desulfococcaceae bacterium HSG8]|nr:DUF1566 domain-containing protein [Desulfococcaceae bacterium HSG8]